MRTILVVLAMAALICGAATADQVTIKGLPYNDVLVTDVTNCRIVFVMFGEPFEKPIGDVTSMKLDEHREFNKAEELMRARKPAEAVAEYDKADQADGIKPWQKRLIRYRRLLALEAACMTGRAVEDWLAVVEECSQSRLAVMMGPSALGGKGSAENARAIRLLEARLHNAEDAAFVARLKQMLAALYAVEGLEDRPTPAKPKAEDAQFASPESLQSAVLRLCEDNLPQAPPPDPKADPGWAGLTEFEKEQKVQEQSKQTALYEKKMEEYKAVIAGLPKHPDFLSKPIAWIALLDHVSPDRQNEGFTVTAISRTGCKIVAFVPASKRQSMMGLTDRAPVAITGKLDTWEFRKPDPGTAGAPADRKASSSGETELTEFRVHLTDASAQPSTSAELERFYASEVKQADPDRKGSAKVAFYGSAAEACYVIYIIDHSGSVVGSFDEIRMQLKRSIANLVPTQQFHVIFFSHDKYEEIQPKRLVFATEENKRRALKALDGIQATGFGSSPIPALEVAFRTFRNVPYKRGMLCYILTDGEFDSSGYEYKGPGGKVLMGNQAVIAWLRTNNKEQGVHVFPIIVGPPPCADTESSLKLLAGENRGRYRYVSNRE